MTNAAKIDAPPLSPERLLRWYTGAVLPMIVLLGSDNIYLPIAPPTAVALCGSFAGGFLLLNLLYWRRSRRSGGLPPSRLLGSFALFCLWTVLGFFYSREPDLAFYAAAKCLVTLTLLCGLLLYTQGKHQMWHMLRLLAGTAAALSLLSVAQVFAAAPLGLDRPLTGAFPTFAHWGAPAVFANVNFFAGYLALHLPLCLCLCSVARSRRESAIATGCAGLVLLGLLLAKSPGGWAAAGVELFAILLYRHAQTGAKKYALLAAAPAGAAALFLLLLAAAPQWLKPLADNAAVGMKLEKAAAGGNLASRLVYWQGAWEIFKKFPLTGAGPLAFIALYPGAIAAVEPWAHPAYIQPLPPHAHSLYLQTLADSGLTGAILLAAFLALLAARARPLLAQPALPGHEAAFYMATALGGFLLHNLMEYNWLLSSFIYLFAVLLVLFDFSTRVEEPAVTWITARSCVIGMAGFALAAAPAVLDFFLYERAIGPAMRGGITLREMIGRADRAAGFCAPCAKPKLALGRAYLELYRQSHDAAQARESMDMLRAAAAAAPHNPAPAVYRGELLLLENRPREAAQAFRQALALQPGHPEILAALARAEELFFSEDKAKAHAANP